MAKIRVTFTTEVIADMGDVDISEFDVTPERIDELKLQIEKDICAGEDGVTVKVDNFEWEVVKDEQL